MKGKLKLQFTYSHHDALVTILIMGLATAVCAALKPISTTDSHVPLIFVLAVLLISRLTDGYLFGLLSSVIAVLGVNYIFTYPYFAFNFSMTGYPLTFVCMFAVATITSTLTAAAKRSEQMRMDSEREKMRANLLRSISHDFRTPLTSIIGSITAILENQNLSAEERNALLLDTKSDAEWLNNMVENILSITRIEMNAKTELHTEPEAVEEVLEEAVTRFRKQYPAQSVEISIPDEVLIIPMDAMLIEQVIMNLLINAAIHGQTVTKIWVSVRREGENAVFRVRDNGVGIKSSLLPRLFSAELLSRDSSKNMGIGLSVCKTIITAHGGTISAENAPDHGALFTFTLPAPKEENHGTQAEDPDY